MDQLSKFSEKCKPSWVVSTTKVDRYELRKFVLEVKRLRALERVIEKTITEAIETAPQQNNYSSVHDYNLACSNHWRSAMMIAQAQMNILKTAPND